MIVTGRLEVEKYEKDGVERTSVTLLADEVGVSLRWPKRAKGESRSEVDDFAGF